jgi:predicted transcriptional regulator
MKNRVCSIAVLAFLVLIIVLASGHAFATPGDSSIWGKVTDKKTAKPINNTRIDVFLQDNTTIVGTGYSGTNGSYAISGLSKGTYIARFYASGYRTIYKDITLNDNESYRADVQLGWDEHNAPAGDNVSLIPVVFVLFVILILAVVISTIMYSKLTHSEILDHDTRRRVYSHIQENPGVHYRAILYNLDLKMGVLSHHIKTLEREGFVKSVPDGLYKRFYPSGYNVDLSYQLSGVQKTVYSVIKENPGISQSNIARLLGINRMLVNYHVKKLQERNLIRMQQDEGRKNIYCYAVQQDT